MSDDGELNIDSLDNLDIFQGHVRTSNLATFKGFSPSSFNFLLLRKLKQECNMELSGVALVPVSCAFEYSIRWGLLNRFRKPVPPVVTRGE